MFDCLYNNLFVFLTIGIVSYLSLFIACNCFYKSQATDLLNTIHSGMPGVFDPMLRFTHNFGNIKFRGTIGLLIYIVLGVIDYFITSSVLNFIFSFIILIGAFNSFTLISSLNRSLKSHETAYNDGRFLKRSYIALFIFRCILYITYILIF